VLNLRETIWGFVIIFSNPVSKSSSYTIQWFSKTPYDSPETWHFYNFILE
jgi:hypothetical protein